MFFRNFLLLAAIFLPCTVAVICHGDGHTDFPWAPTWRWVAPNEVHINPPNNWDSLTQRCTAPEMRFADARVLYYCSLKCSGWVPPTDLISWDYVQSLIDQYQRIRSLQSSGQQFDCNPHNIAGRQSWPHARQDLYARVFQDYPTLCSKYVYGVDDTPEVGRPFRLGCACPNIGHTVQCPSAFTAMTLFAGHGPGMPTFRRDIGDFSPEYASDYVEILLTFKNECQQSCVCHRPEELEERAKKIGLELFGPRLLNRPDLTYSWRRTFGESSGSGSFSGGGNVKIVQNYRTQKQRSCGGKIDCPRGFICSAIARASRLVLGVSRQTLYTTACVAASQMIRTRERLNGRSLEEPLNDSAASELLDLLCVCNATYASRACCELHDGIVHEH